MKLILGFNFGANNQHAYINDRGEVHEETFDIHDTVDFIFSHPNVEEVIFVGPEAMLLAYAARAKQYELTNYGLNKIEYKIRSTFNEISD